MGATPPGDTHTADVAGPTGGHRRTRGELIGAGLGWSARWSIRIVAVVAVIALSVWLIGQLWSIFLPIFLALILATLLRPPSAWLMRHRIPPTLATLGVLLVALTALVGLGFLLAPQVIGQAGTLTQATVAGLGRVRDWLAGPPFNLGSSQFGSIIDNLTRRLQQSATAIASTVLGWLGSLAGVVVDVVLAVVLAFLFVKDGSRFLPWVRRVSGPAAGRHLDAALTRSWLTLGGFVRSQALVGLVDAVFIGIGLVVLGVPLAVPLAVLTFFAAFVPIVGAITAGALAVLVALVSNGLANALLVLLVVVAVQQIEGNVLQPIIQGRSLGLHPAVVLLAVTAGGSLFGVTGALFGVPVVAVGVAVLGYISEQINARTDAPASATREGPGHGTPTSTTGACTTGACTTGACTTGACTTGASTAGAEAGGVARDGAGRGSHGREG